MKKDKQKAKRKEFCYAIKMRLFIVLAFILFHGCSSNEEEATNTAITESQDPEVNLPLIQTPAPLIHLADNLDEQDQLGWCIDTRGNGFNENLHTHSCKASGGDVQFIYNEETLQICSVEFTGYCVEMSGGPIVGMSLSLVESNTDSPDQRFVYNESSGEFNPEEDTSLCMAAGNTSAAAGIYMSRSLTLEISSETEENLKKWVIVSN
ncbi:hypothetical protein [Roseivirga sp.]|uniref:hypothetical protein n=1 Tax=Roseivirga sp. TaxID=1964215 RepID=UPI003B8E92A8